MRSYQEALAHYDSIKKPPRSKHWNKGGERDFDGGKPLRRTSEWHMSIHKCEFGVIYYQLYNTKIAQFYPPNADGSERRLFKYIPTQTTNAFMTEYHLHFHNVEMDDGTTAHIPYVQNGGWKDNDMVTADLMFDKYGRVLRGRSSHKDVYTMVSSAEDKAKRKAFREAMQPIVELATFNMPAIIENAQLDEQYGKPFGTAYNEPREVYQLKRFLQNCPADINNPEFVSSFMSAAQGVFDVHASRKAYNAGGFDYANSYWNRDTGVRYTTEESNEIIRMSNMEKARIQEEILRSSSSEEFGKALTNMLLSCSGLLVGKVKKPWGQFMPKLPVKWIS